MESLEKINELLQKGKFDEAIPLLESASKQGDYFASYHLAELYTQGIGVNRDLDIAGQYFDEAFKQINNINPTIESNFLLATFYLFGLGSVSKDEVRAVELLEKCAEGKNIPATVLLANCYKNGTGCDVDFERCFTLVDKVKDYNHPLGKKIYADCLFNGLGTEVDQKKAVNYYEQAGKLGDISAIFVLGTLYHEGKCVEQDDKKAFEYFLKAANANYPNAIKNVAYFYANGIYVKQDLRKEEEYIKKLADLGIAEGMLSYGRMCLDINRGLYKYAEGIDYLKKAVVLKEPRAIHIVAQIYEKGLYGVFTNQKLAFNNYMMAYNLGFKPAAHDILRCLKGQIGTNNNPSLIAQFEKIVEELKETNKNEA